MDDRQQFWHEREKWPRDDPSYVFLGRAVQSLGRVMFPADWTGAEPGTPPAYDLAKLDPSAFFGLKDYVSYSEADYHQHRQVRRLLRMPDLGPPERERLSQDDWYKGLVLAAQSDAETSAARLHFWHVREAITDALTFGVIQSAFWNRDAGRMEPIHLTWWTVEDVSDRFDFCTINPRTPFDQAGRGRGTCAIFIDRRGIYDLLHTFASATPSIPQPDKVRSGIADVLIDPVHSKPQQPTTRRGPPPFSDVDGPAIGMMRKLIESGEARSPNQAAGIVVASMKVHGLGNSESKAKRLTRSYKEQFGSG